MTDASYWIVFFTAALMLNISPGPDLIYIISRTIAHGTKVGLASAAGVCTGALVHVFAAAAGLSAILATSPIAFTVAKYTGAVYLLFLGSQSLRTKGAMINWSSADTSQKISPLRAYWQGIFIDALNPKVAIFFMAFLPQFVRAEHGNVTVQIVGLGILVILVAVVVESWFVLTAARSTAYLRRHPAISVWLDRALGGVLVVLGIRLALAEAMI